MKKIHFVILLIVFVSNKSFTQTQTHYDTLSVGKIKQVISYKGKQTSPLILFLHGGPGSSRMNQAEKFTNKLEDHFLVVQWDQRDAGRTLALNKSSEPITLELMENDTYELVKLLLKKFNKQKIYLAGESWGTVLGFYMTQKHPDLLNAYLAFSPVIDQSNSERILLDKLKADAKEKHNTAGEKELKTVKIPFENYQQIFYSRKWMFNYDGQPFADKDTTVVKEYLKSWSDTWMPTWNKAIKQNLFKDLPSVKCPVYFFIGEKDLQTNFTIAEKYFDKLKAPKKKIFLFKDAGHSVLTEKSEEVQKIIIDEILKGS
ncbi:alpha/beta fold hydrolase [Flavobacterium quisquiliarum]|uniref:Alpha/beta fold hydrolase n=1 Tax=Flavobacterium quisquiliarum TaxID=1834436 RepID=A0ABV8WDV1_9FLAO|nr:alpha/beta hydrolase [Flavobacterium quisquiliarum]MBW1656739.1 alpha/beta fold hydrolase [Flavobacterium quisquiliarum]NWL00366.1 alpha/beta hydrolase [Flavobacterium collinsii]